MSPMSKTALLGTGLAVALAAIVAFFPRLMTGSFALITLTVFALAFVYVVVNLVMSTQHDSPTKRKRSESRTLTDADLDRLVASLDDEQAEGLLERLQQRDSERVLSLDEALSPPAENPNRVGPPPQNASHSSARV